MEKRRFGNLGDISSLTLGGGGTGQVWGPTSQQEAVATVKSAVNWGITFLDAAPSYGDGKAEDVIGEAFMWKVAKWGAGVHQVPFGQPTAWRGASPASDEFEWQPGPDEA